MNTRQRQPVFARLTTGWAGTIHACTLGLVLFTAAGSRAQVNSWTNALSQFWDVTANWSLNLAPTNTQSVYITNAGTKTVTIDSITSSVSNRMTVANLTISGPGGAINTLSMNFAGTAGSNTLRVLNALTLATNGALTINSSAFEVRGTMSSFSFSALTNDGTITLNSGSFICTNNSASAVIGQSGSGTFQLNGGIAHFNSLFLGNLAGSQGVFNQTGGTNLLDNAVILANGSGGSATYNLTNGVLQTGINGIIFADQGAGVINQYGGTNQSGGIQVTYSGSGFGSSTYNLFGGVLNTGSEQQYSNEHFNQYGGLHISGGILLGFQSVGPGYYLQNGGTNLVTGFLQFGLNSGGAGYYYLYNGFLGDSVCQVGTYVGQGSIYQSNGVHWVTNALTIGDGAAANGYYELDGGLLNASNIYLGTYESNGYGSNTGTFYMTGGTNNVRSNLYVGYDLTNSGTFTLTGNGILNAASAEVGTFGSGTFLQSAGSATVTNNLTVGDGANSRGSYTLGGGTLNAGSAFIGHNGVGIMTQSSATNLLSNTFYLGDGPTGNGSYTLTNGLFAANLGYIGGAGTGSMTQLGGLATFTNSLTLALAAAGSGTYRLLGGVLSAGSVLINAGGTFVEESTVNTGIGTIYGALSLLGGIWNGRLVNYASLGVGPLYFDVTNGLANFSTITLTNLSALALDGLGLDNEGSLALAGGTLAGNGPLANNAGLSGYGTIAGTGGFVNNALVTASGGDLTLNNSGANANAGEIDLAAGWQLRLGGGPLANGGGLDLNGGVVAGLAQLNNNPGGTVSGHGSVTAPFFNNTGGLVLLDSGTMNISQTFSNSGSIQLTTAAANFTGGLINNRGTVQGLGNVGNNLANNGTIEAVGGTLNLDGAVANGAGGTLSAPAGAKLLLNSGLSSQAGVITLSGGTFDNNGWPLNNAGQISGYGTFRSGGLANNGSVTFSGGTSTINGSVTNQATRRLTVAYNPALFTGTTVNNGTVKITQTTVEFTGTYIENGTFISDPATNYFAETIVGPGGYFLGGASDLFSVTGDFLNGSRQSAAWETSAATLVFRGALSHAFELAAADAGTNYSGFATNFAWGTMRLAAGESLVLQHGPGPGAAAVYVRNVILEGGLAQISAITGNGMNIYYDRATAGNAYLGGGTYALNAGGALVPVTAPSIQIVSIQLVSGNVLLTCTGEPNIAHQVQASTNLLNWATLASVTASPAGTFTFTDTTAHAFTTRFYRLHVP